MRKTNYIFHFIISGKINDSLNYLRKTLNFDSNYKLIDFMLDIISKNIYNIKKIIGDHHSEYEFIDTEDLTRIDKYVKLTENKYKMLKKLHFLYNEYGMSGILREIINFFYNGIIKYGAKEFLSMIGNKLNIDKIKYNINYGKTHMRRISVKKLLLYAQIIDNLSIYV
ncbi:MAG: hypothetical protein KA885_02125 [Spirochaetes bacterium]|nr:hypothetical protein [Spirochaetota bacterium]